MTFNSILNDLVTSVDENQAIIEQLLNWRGGETLVGDDSNTQPDPQVNETTGVWTVNQDTADTDGVFKGIYTFALDTACSYLTIVSVSGHTTPTGFPSARYTDCNDVVHDLTSVNDLDGKQVKRFEIYSDTAFIVTLSVSGEPPSVCWDFTQGSQGWGDSSSSGEFQSNRYRMRSNQQYAVGCFRVAFVSPTGLNLSNITGVSIDWDCSGGNSRNNNINQNYIRYVYTDGTQEELNMPNFDIPSSGFVGTQSYSVPQSDPNKTVNQVVIIHREWLPVGGSSSTGTIYVYGICLETL